ncbi:MAG: 30S ribosome-binding factor RbfA [Phycisphaerae bacterium]|nr:30S ribosome-binding factor RbfA [Phycisphaerae bacterium]MDD5380674.1 30S ribosome-binding factor RbfA [Phycisphaerae bacterium]
MATRRQEKAARAIKEAVSDAIANHLNDPRIEGFVSVTRVDVAVDLRSAEVYLSIFGKNDTAQDKTYEAITHARSRIQSLLAGSLQCKFCPVLRFHKDENFKKTLETIKLIEQAASERKKRDSVDEKQEPL